MSFGNIRQRRVATNGISLNVAEQGEGPLVLMLHGFPESWYSWRHQFAALAEAGYHAVAPDMRGYGGSDKPDEISAYVGEFERSGFRGPLNYYRNLNLTWRLTEGAPSSIDQPALFVAGEKDGVILMAAEALRRMPERVPNLRTNELLPGIGHWTQQEAPDAVNRHLIDFLRGLDA